MDRDLHGRFGDTLLDLISLSTLPLLLLGLQAITTEPIRERLSFQFTDPTVTTALTSTVVHWSWQHVLSNSVLFGITVGCVYVIFRLWDRRREFWAIFVAILLLTPLITAGFDFLILNLHLGVTHDDATTRGFSGVGTAYAGMLVATIGFFVADRSTPGVGAAVVFLLYLLSALVFLFVHQALTVLAGGLLAFGFVLTGLWIFTALDSPLDYYLDRIGHEHGLEIAVVAYSILVIVVVIYAGFPADISRGETTTNILSHGTGLLTGFVLTTALLGLWRRSDVGP